MASTELNELIRRAEMLSLDEQLYLIAHLEEQARATNPNGTEEGKKPLVGEELVALLESLDALPLESEPDPNLSTNYRDILYPKQGDMP